MKTMNYLLGYSNLKIMQDTEMFRFSLDSVLLPNFITINQRIHRIMDIGCGNGPIPLILSTKTKAHITGVEIQKEAYNLAQESVELNHLGHQIDLICGDINEVYKEYETDTFDIITCNPPYFVVNNDSHFNQSHYKTKARHEVSLSLEDIMNVSKKLLKNNGILGIVHRPDRLIDILMLMRRYRIEPKKLQFIYPHHNSEANILLVEGRKNGKPGLKIMPPLYTHLDNGEYTEQLQKYFQ